MFLHTLQHLRDVLIISTVIAQILVTNLVYTMYHLYMRRLPDSQSRLLNVFYSHVAILLQIGSFFSVLLLLQSLDLLQLNVVMLRSDMQAMFYGIE